MHPNEIILTQENWPLLALFASQSRQHENALIEQANRQNFKVLS